MAEDNPLVLIFLLVIAVPATLAFSSHSWYCQRLVPRFITSAVTPCTYPCLVVSSHEHPHIIVQNEPNGTPCMIQKASHDGGKIGMCRNSFCVQELPHKVLKRKKRFICLYALARIIKLKKQRRKLEDEIGQLRQRLADNRDGDVGNELGGRVGGAGNGGAEGLGGGIAGTDAGEDTGPENFPSGGSGVINSDFAARGGVGPEIAGIGPFGVGSGYNSEGGMGAARVPHNTNYGSGPVDNGDDGAAGAAQVRLRDGGGVGGNSDTGRLDSLGGAAERGGGGGTAYYG